MALQHISELLKKYMQLKNKEGENLYLTIIKYEAISDSYYVKTEKELSGDEDEIFLIKEVTPVRLEKRIVHSEQL